MFLIILQWNYPVVEFHGHDLCFFNQCFFLSSNFFEVFLSILNLWKKKEKKIFKIFNYIELHIYRVVPYCWVSHSWSHSTAGLSLGFFSAIVGQALSQMQSINGSAWPYNNNNNNGNNDNKCECHNHMGRFHLRSPHLTTLWAALWTKLRARIKGDSNNSMGIF